MKIKRRRKGGNSVLRMVYVAISVLLQVGWMLLMVLELNEYYTQLSLLTSLLALLTVLRIHSHHTNTALKTPWIMLILVFPPMGLCMYLLFETLGNPPGVRRRLRDIRSKASLVQPEGIMEELETRDPYVAGQFRYLLNQAGSPVYQNTRVTYYPEAKDAFEALKAAAEQAESFIFLEYFIIQDGTSFEAFRDILRRKAAQGVEVRLMYDDIGSAGYATLRFARELRADGINCQVFNPAVPAMRLFMNHRDHRKIAVIDGKVGFTGGFNLADEYFGLSCPYGHWKDTGVRLEGEAVQSLITTFLELWNVCVRGEESPDRYLAEVWPVPGAEGFVQHFGDNPMTGERLAENMFLNMISSARASVWIMTPYLIITDEMNRALGLAAKRGVDVRIITPGIPDKKIVYALTRSYYAGLVQQGVRIFEYTPGFCHGKMCVCDGDLAAIGTSNLDYRSLYHHFENNVLLYNCQAARDIAADFVDMFPRCREVSEKYRTGRSRFLRIGQCVLRLFAPLM